MFRDVFRTKNISHIIATADGHASLKRTLGPVQLTLLGIGAIIGAGIFSAVGSASIRAASTARTVGGTSMFGNAAARR